LQNTKQEGPNLKVEQELLEVPPEENGAGGWRERALAAPRPTYAEGRKKHFKPVHERMLQWLVVKGGSLKELAREFEYTPASISRIVHSDLFQAEYKRRCEELGTIAVHSVGSKLGYLGALALDESIRRFEEGEVTERFISETRDSVLDRLGFTSKGKGEEGEPQKHLHLHVDAETIVRAREKALAT